MGKVGGIEIDVGIPTLEFRGKRFAAPLRGEAEPAFPIINGPVCRRGR